MEFKYIRKSLALLCDSGWFKITALIIVFILGLTEVFTMVFVITDSDPIPTYGEYAFFISLVLVKGLLACILIIQSGPITKIISLYIATPTLLWGWMMVVGTYSHIFEVINVPKLLIVCDFVSLITNITIVIVSIIVIIKNLKNDFVLNK